MNLSRIQNVLVVFVSVVTFLPQGTFAKGTHKWPYSTDGTATNLINLEVNWGEDRWLGNTQGFYSKPVDYMNSFGDPECTEREPIFGALQGDARLEFWVDQEYFLDGRKINGWAMVADYEMGGQQFEFMMAYCPRNPMVDDGHIMHCNEGSWRYFDMCKKSGSYQWLKDPDARTQMSWVPEPDRVVCTGRGCYPVYDDPDANAEGAPEWMEAYQQGPPPPETNDEGNGVDAWMLGAIIGGLSVIVIVAVAVAFWKWSTRKSSSKEAETEMVKEVGAANVVHVVDESVAEVTGKEVVAETGKAEVVAV